MILPLQVGALTALLISAVDPDIAEGLSLYQRLKYDRAVVALGRALTKAELSADDRRTGLETLGFAYTVLGDTVNAELVFHALLDRFPTYDVDDELSPRLRSAFAQAKSSWLEGRAITFELTSPEASRELTGSMIGGDPRRVGSVSTRDDEKKTSPLYCKDRACRGERPERAFWIDVFDHAGAVLHTSGPFMPYAGGGGPDWWVWAAIAAGVVGAGVAVTAIVAGADDPPSGSLGRLQLP